MNKRTASRKEIISGNEILKTLKHQKIILSTILNVLKKEEDLNTKERKYWNRALRVTAVLINKQIKNLEKHLSE